MSSVMITARVAPATTSQLRPEVIRTGFTLMELLVVIGIIGILAGLVFGGVMLAKRSALKAKTMAQMQQIQAACESYRTATGMYPEGPKSGNPLTRDWDDKFLVSPTPPLEFKAFNLNLAPTDPTIDQQWKEVATDLLIQLAGIGTQLDSKLMTDAWKHPIRYRPARYYPFLASSTSGATIAAIDSDKPPANDSYQLWSIGPDGLDGGGEQASVNGKDDLVSWPR